MQQNEINNLVHNLHKVATELLPKATELSGYAFDERSKDADVICMSSKRFFSFMSKELEEAVKDVDFSYMLVTDKWECFITKNDKDKIWCNNCDDWKPKATSQGKICFDCYIGIMEELIADDERHHFFKEAHERWVSLQKHKKEHGLPYDEEGMNKPFIEPTPEEIKQYDETKNELRKSFDEKIDEVMKENGDIPEKDIPKAG